MIFPKQLGAEGKANKYILSECGKLYMRRPKIHKSLMGGLILSEVVREDLSEERHVT